MSASLSITVLGGAGFIGQRLCRDAVKRGYRVVSLDRRKADIPDVEERVADIGSAMELRTALPATDTLIILIGQIGPTFDPQKELTNLQASAALWHQIGCRRVLYASTSLVYGDCSAAADEETPPAPVEPYAVFKRDAERLLHDVAKHSGITLGILRFGNVYGAGGRGVVSRLMEHARSGTAEPFTVNGDGLQERDYTYVDDVAAGLLAILDRIEGSDTVNLATGTSTTLLNLIEQVEKVTGHKIPYATTGAKPPEAGAVRLDVTKLQERYAFAARYPLKKGLKSMWKELAD